MSTSDTDNARARTRQPVINMARADLAAYGPPDGSGPGATQFGAMIARLGPAVGAEKLGCTLVVVEPGKRAWPYHLHHTNEEMYVILDGTGTLRFGPDEHPLTTGDVAACPPGPGTAHQIINTGDTPLRYLVISTMEGPEVAEYPDSGKIGALAGVPGDKPYPLFHLSRRSDAKDYWDGEV